MLDTPRLEFKLSVCEPTTDTSGSNRGLYADAFHLLGELQNLAQVLSMIQDVDEEKLHHIAWRAAKVTDDLCFAASAAGEAQRRRIHQAA
jgi:hypothetical protein